ncbi:MAG: Asp-tRNA(Asn)/Glu-tRNA(Gln) amidotransferase subunit GatA, partial [Bacteroidetes bacterium]|nr:Asp-tRNA(Asn)/Glu-tRNA(Gln) amidotransferase subunit GatA [Bacteroidota bacterium]
MLESYDAIRERLDRGEESVEARVTAHLTEIERRGSLNAYLQVFNDTAVSDARAVDVKLRSGAAGPLAGMVIAVKDVISMQGRVTTCGSAMLKDFTSIYDATVIERLRAADAVIIGKTNMDEFAMGSSGENSAFGPTLHPLDETKVPGGSSSGSCVAVAAGLATASLGTDTGGSIRQPAGFCGIVGLKPTYGRVSRYGLVAFASSFDQIGPFARTTRDAARVLQAIAGNDPKDATSAPVEMPDLLPRLDRNVQGMRIGLPKEYFSDALHAGIRTVLERKIDALRRAGAEIVTVSLPHSEHTISTYYILATAEASSNLARYDGARYGFRSSAATDLNSMYVRSRSEGFGSEVKRRIMLGTYVLSSGYYDAYYRKAQQVRRLIQNDFVEAFRTVDCIITPIAPTTAFGLGEKMEDPLQMYLND